MNNNLNTNIYCAVDVETPNRHNDSICQIAVVKVKDGIIIEEYSSYINPECEFDEININVHGITSSMINDAPRLIDVWPKINNLLDNQIILGHNIKFDLCVLTKALKKYDIDFPIVNYIDTLFISKNNLLLEHCTLDNVCKQLNIEYNHHDALSDAKASAMVFEYFKNNNYLSDNIVDSYQYKGNCSCINKCNKHIFSADTREMRELKGAIEGILSDELITEKEVLWLHSWLLNHEHLIGNYPFDKINNLVNNILEDGYISPLEFEDLEIAFRAFLEPVHSHENNDKIDFNEKIFCLTGNFESGTKEEVAEKVINKGGIYSKNVTQKINFLIVGGLGNDSWKFGNYGGKVQQAMAYKEKGKDITIMSEDDLINYLEGCK